MSQFNCKVVPQVPLRIVMFRNSNKSWSCTLEYSFRGSEYRKSIGKEAFSMYLIKYIYNTYDHGGTSTYELIGKKT